jgi:hypothetical protein
MLSKDMFKLAVQLLGLLFLYHALYAVQPALVQIIDSLPHQVGRDVRVLGSFWKFSGGLFMVGWPLLVAYWLLRGAPLIMRLAYPDPPASTPAERAFEAQFTGQTDAKH